MKLYTVTGCIASGKSTLANSLGSCLNCSVLEEDAAGNPWLDKYYKDMKKYAFKMQTWYLNRRISQLLQHKDNNIVVQDQMLAAFSYVFPSVQELHGNMSVHERAMISDIMNIFNKIDSESEKPIESEIIFYLRIPEKDVDRLVNRINFRNRNCESNITEDYLSDLIAEYERWYYRSPASDRKVIEIDALQPTIEILKQALEKIQ